MSQKMPDNKRFLKIIFVLFFAAGCYLLAPAGLPEAARRVLFVFVLAALLWAFEIIPLYATSLGVVISLILLLCRPGGVLAMDALGYQTFLLPFGSPVIMLFFGGLVLARALQKYSIDHYIAAKFLKVFGNKPFFLMLGFMSATAFLSMWMSNTATTAMMMAMIIPLAKQIDERDPFRTGLLLSIPFAANIGGIATPVGTPPNAIAIGILANEGVRISFIGWMKMALPLAVIILIVISVILFIVFRPKQKSINFQIKEDLKLDIQAYKVAGVVILTIGLWLGSEWHKIPSAVVALLGAGSLAILNLLERKDFNKIDWDVLVLMWGGLALGKALDISGLSSWIVEFPVFGHHGFGLVAIFCVLGVVLSTFMSNTAAANLLVPIAIAVPGQNHVLLAVTIALSCSVAMALPISTPPNAIAFSSKMLKSADMLKAGILVSLISLALVLAGYEFMILKAFGSQ